MIEKNVTRLELSRGRGNRRAVPAGFAELDGQRLAELAGKLCTARPFLPRLMERWPCDHHRHRFLQRHRLRLLHLLGFQYRPKLANLPDQRLPRIAHYGRIFKTCISDGWPTRNLSPRRQAPVEPHCGHRDLARSVSHGRSARCTGPTTKGCRTVGPRARPELRRVVEHRLPRPRPEQPVAWTRLSNAGYRRDAAGRRSSAPNWS